LIEKVKEIKLDGSTNLWGGVEQGAKLLVKHRKSGYVSRLFLFSDGLVNHGLTNKAAIMSKVGQELYEQEGILVSAFGLGADFDEELMKGIAENGNGAYFFIEGSNSIPTFVAFAIKSLLKNVGTDAVLKVRGVNSGLVIKFHGHHDVMKGARLGDLQEDNVRSILCQIEVRGDVKEDEQEVMQCDLVYQKKGDMQEIIITVPLVIKFTEDASEVEKNRSPKVTVQLVVQETAQIDREMVKLIDENKKKKAIELQEKQIKLLEGVEDMDNNILGGAHKISALLKQARTQLERLKKEGASKEVRKEAHHREYEKSRGDGGYSSLYY